MPSSSAKVRGLIRFMSMLHIKFSTLFHLAASKTHSHGGAKKQVIHQGQSRGTP